ncbi:hypothetical protein Aca07nite_86610 [Actinoplanes capillaceus]|uniref:PH domain-containing protein n=1 Tax=Actinoplanes campanulatus TaxID=113559 RepID=A0ABQ3WYZ1_9ACTN|nr:hypothetical protein Aca07nite_86610 [Actinoplanes capillaceus]
MSIQFTPDSTAQWMVAIESVSSCGPQAYSQSLPPITQAPRPVADNSIPVAPSGRVGTVESVMAVTLAQTRGHSQERALPRHGMTRQRPRPHGILAT